jgi:hypothetical protein
VVWHRAKPVLGPVTEHFDQRTPITVAAPINSALRHLGAQTLAHRDEFEALGLSRYRQVEDW